MKHPCKEGDRIRLIDMPDDPCPIPAGTTGTVIGICPWTKGWFQINVKWDIKRSLSMIYPIDTFEVLTSGAD